MKLWYMIPALLVFLGACSGEQTGTWERLNEETAQMMQQEERERTLPYDLTAFLSAEDRQTLKDEGSLFLQDACGVTVESATVDGSLRLRPICDDYAKQTKVTPDGSTAVTQGLSSLWISTAEGTVKHRDYCQGNLLMQPDSNGFVYCSGQAAQDYEIQQVYWYDLGTGMETALTTDPAYCYETFGWLDEQTVLCVRNLCGTPEELELAAVGLDGTVLPLAEKVTVSSDLRVENGFVFLAPRKEAMQQGTVLVSRWNGEILEPVWTMEAAVLTYWPDVFSPEADKLVVGWGDSVEEDAVWQLRVVDLSNGQEQDYRLPEGAKAELLFVDWWEKDAMLVMAYQDTDSSSEIEYWTFTLPYE